MITSPSNVEGTNDLTNSSCGSGTPPWLHHVGPTMTARARPKPSPRQLEDLRRPSASSWCFSIVLAALWWTDGWMWRPMEAEAIYRRATRSKGHHEPPQKGARPAGLGQPAWASRPGPVSAPVRSPTLLGQMLTCSLIHVGPWRCLLHGLDRVPCHASFSMFCSGP
jgi:hypothetical protein